MTRRPARRPGSAQVASVASAGIMQDSSPGSRNSARFVALPGLNGITTLSVGRSGSCDLEGHDVGKQDAGGAVVGATLAERAAAAEREWLKTIPVAERPIAPPDETVGGDRIRIIDAGGRSSSNYRETSWVHVGDPSGTGAIDLGAIGELGDVIQRDSTKSDKPAKLPPRTGFEEYVWRDEAGNELSVELNLDKSPDRVWPQPSKVAWVAGVLMALSACKWTQLERNRQKNTPVGAYDLEDETPVGVLEHVHEVVAAHHTQLPEWADNAALMFWLFSVLSDEGGGTSGQLSFSRLRDELEHPHKLAKTIREQAERRADKTIREAVGNDGLDAARVWAAYSYLADSVDPLKRRVKTPTEYLRSSNAKKFLRDEDREPRDRSRADRCRWILRIIREANWLHRRNVGHVHTYADSDDSDGSPYPVH